MKESIHACTEAFNRLLETAYTLLGPEGCPWDREQTVVSMRSSILEEACEVIEAIDEQDDPNLIEELGDLLYNVLFFALLAEKEDRFQPDAPIRAIHDKLIARHPHVFGGKTLTDAEAAINQWEELKAAEKTHRESVLDGIPKGLPALSRADKMAGRMKKKGYGTTPTPTFETEEELGTLLWEIAKQARCQGLHPEHALRKTLVEEEKAFRTWESN